jgi:hypothetical protein
LPFTARSRSFNKKMGHLSLVLEKISKKFFRVSLYKQYM